MASGTAEQPRGDEFFTAEQIVRLSELMACWRTARDSNALFSSADQSELNALIATEFAAAIARSAARLTEEQTGGA